MARGVEAYKAGRDLRAAELAGGALRPRSAYPPPRRAFRVAFQGGAVYLPGERHLASTGGPLHPVGRRNLLQPGDGRVVRDNRAGPQRSPPYACTRWGPAEEGVVRGGVLASAFR